MAADQFVPTDDFAEIKAIAMSDDDGPVLMVNLNKYAEGEYPDGAAYKDYMAALDILLERVGGNTVADASLRAADWVSATRRDPWCLVPVP